MSAGAYKPERFWENRYEVKPAHQAPGDAGLSDHENAQAYIKARRDLFNLFGRYLLGQSVLELGCGNGHYISVYNRCSIASYTGVDISKTALAFCRARFTDHTFIRGDIGECKESADVIICIDVLQHVVDDVRFRKVMGIMGRGKVVIATGTVGPQSGYHCKTRTIGHLSKHLGDCDQRHPFRDKEIGLWLLGE